MVMKKLLILLAMLQGLNLYAQRNPFSLFDREMSFATHFVDFYVGGARIMDDPYSEEEPPTWTGFTYTWLKDRKGYYVSLGRTEEKQHGIIGGVAYRVFLGENAPVDIHVYAGVGIIDGATGLDFGIRIGRPSIFDVSCFDVSIGCQIYRDRYMPTVGFGLYIWGIPTLICLAAAL